MSEELILHARIDEISAEIALQKTLLKNLEQDRNLVQRQLDAVLSLDPDHLTQEHPNSLHELGAHRAPMLLMNICNAWSAIALAMPALGLSRLLPIRSRRAKNHPLSITLGGDISYLGSRVSAVIWNYGEQLKHLEICEKELRYAGSGSARGATLTRKSTFSAK
ncbi:hypothetical protein DFH08DRAFT_974256 [Mycena albidolilacea]|uniref:Uncharacterized protein n=1 Tax=Mycena albidolilacea TaxID=1033008 RepID=A0AAD6Z869_9AGAR|nr:hypothetical protein DFH08DRAFT_974256 [Mycena albidolilacea]